MGEFRRTQSKVWWSHYPDDEDDEMPTSSPSLAGWGAGVPLSPAPDRVSPSNSHKSQDSGFSDSDSSPSNSKEDESPESHTVSPRLLPEPHTVSPRLLPEPHTVSPRLLPETPVARIPRACLTRRRKEVELKSANKTWAGESPQTSGRYLKFNQSDVLSVFPDCQEGRTSFVETCDDELPKNSVKENETERDTSDKSETLDSSLDSSLSTTEQTAVFIPKPSPKTRRRPSSPVLSRPCTPPRLSPARILRTPNSRLSSWGSDLDVTGLGAPTDCSTPKTAAGNRVPWATRVGRLPARFSRSFYSLVESEPAVVEPAFPAPVVHWQHELRSLYEPECMTTLQSKSLTADLSRQVTLMAAVTTDAVRTLQNRTRTISMEFTKLYRKVEQSKLEHVGPLVQSLLGHINELLAVTDQAKSDCSELLGASDSLRALATSAKPEQSALSDSISRLGHAFTAVVDNLLAEQIRLLVSVVEEPSSNLALLSALCALPGLGLEASHLGTLMARCGGVRALLAVCLDSKSSSIRTSALRVLATVCCSTTTIRQFEQEGGAEIIADILSDEKRLETEVTEAVSVLAQITAPWVEDNHSVMGLSEQLTTLVASLTRLAGNTTSSPTLLLTAAALCHLSLLEPQSVWRLIDCNTAGTLLLAVRREGPSASVFLQEQAAGLIANMAAVAEARPHLAENRAVVALLCFLQVRHSPLQRVAEIQAAERLQHKTAIALSRLCSDGSVAEQVVELQGVNRLVRLCKEERERNNSDGVLVACLAALRKIVATCGIEVVDSLNARELVEPRLLDSYLLYSSRQESYV